VLANIAAYRSGSGAAEVARHSMRLQAHKLKESFIAYAGRAPVRLSVSLPACLFASCCLSGCQCMQEHFPGVCSTCIQGRF
jgi:hypothetical protein